ncbi:hypothetical protein JOQ06_026502, partial [Pogonophryne albipinna]
DIIISQKQASRRQETHMMAGSGRFYRQSDVIFSANTVALFLAGYIITVCPVEAAHYSTSDAVKSQSKHFSAAYLNFDPWQEREDK